MEKDYISIGEMAKLNTTTVATLRLYDEIDLLKPAYINNETGYRYYHINQSARLDLISYMKELGMNLKEIKESLDKEDLSLIKNILIQKRASLELEIENKQTKKDAINRTIYSLDRYLKSPTPGTITLEFIDRRRIYVKKNDVDFYKYDISVYENILKDFKKHLFERGISGVYYTNTATYITKENFLKRNFVAGDLFVFVDKHFPYKAEIKHIESSMFVCIYLDDFYAEVEYANKLYDYIKEHQLEVIGDYICEVLTELNFADHNKRSMFFRIQVPVKFK